MNIESGCHAEFWSHHDIRSEINFRLSLNTYRESFLKLKEKFYFVGKIVDVNYLSSRILLANDLNSKIPVIIEPGGINAILTGKGNNEYAELEFLPKNKIINDGGIVYTSGVDGIIDSAIPIGKIFLEKDKKYVKFFVDFNQIKFVKINN